MARKPSDTKMFRVSLPKTLIDDVDNQHWGERREIKDIVAEALVPQDQPTGHQEE